jgi:hypothetical protein
MARLGRHRRLEVMNAHTDVIAVDHPPHLDGQRPARWAVRAAHVVAVIALPSGLWRIGVAVGLSMGVRVAVGAPPLVNPGVSAYIFGLTIVSEAVALLALGLVRPWGEAFPQWLPAVGGRRVPPAFATTVAATGAVAMMAIWTFATVNFFVLTVYGAPGRGFVFISGWWEALFVACYAPLLLWGPLLLTITWAYHRRRTRPTTH